jgi:hypothetical protein
MTGAGRHYREPDPARGDKTNNRRRHRRPSHGPILTERRRIVRAGSAFGLPMGSL